MKKNKIVALLATVIALMGLLGFFACEEPSASSGPEYCVVSFDKNGGDSADIARIKVEKGKTMGAAYPDKPSKDGYKFDGWYDESVNPHEKYESDTRVAKNLNLKAHWKGLTHTVTFDKNAPDATEPSPASKTVTVPATTIDALPTLPVRAGYGFAGWFDTDAENGGNQFTEATAVNGDITVYARWTINTDINTDTVYTVTFNKNASDATEPNPASKTVTTPMTTIDSLPTLPARTGYTFAGWNTQADGSGTAFVQTTTVSANISVHAQWTANTLTIGYADGGGSGPTPASPTSAVYGTSVTMPANPYARTGYTFAGWAVSGTGSVSGTHAAGASVAVNALSTGINSGDASITLTATWTENDTYTVTFNKNASDATEPSPARKTVTLPAVTVDALPTPPARVGYIFTGWNTQANGSGTAFVQTTTVSANISVYAQWTANKLTIGYANGGGTGSVPTSPTSADYGTSVTMPTNPYTRTGYSFAGWAVSGTGSVSGTHAAGANVVVSALSTGINSGDAGTLLTAQWKANTLSIGYAGGGGTGSAPTEPASADYGTNVTMPANTYNKTGYTFTGWKVSGTGSVDGTHAAGTSVAVNALSTGVNTGNAVITLTAQWTANTLSISYANGGGTGSAPVSPILADYGTNVTMPANPYTYTGHSFAGWAVSGKDSVDGTHQANTSVAVSALSTGINTGDASITLTAVWTMNDVYLVTFNKNASDATEPNPTTKTVTAPATTTDSLPTPPVRTGYTFADWNTQADGKGTVFVQTTTVSASISVYAKWTANTLTINYANGGGTGSAPIGPTSAAYGTSVTMPANTYTRTGYTFTGWAVSGTGSVSGTHAAGASVAVSALSTGINSGGASITLTATWTANTYTVTFDKNASDATDASPAKKTVTVPAINIDSLPTAPVRTGYTFNSWNTQTDGKGTTFVQTTTVSANITVYAQWTANVYTVTFDKNASDATDASPATKTVTVPATTINALPTSPARTGYTFAGWNTQADGKGTAFSQTTTVSANITVYAQWTANPVYTVTFNKNASDATEANPGTKTVTVPVTTIDALPTAPMRTGYTFAGWNTQTDGKGTAFVQTTTVSANITIYAQWTANTLLISYVDGGGSGPTPPSPTSAAYGTSVTMPANPFTRTGYTFAGWAVSGTGSVSGTYAAGASVAVTALSTGINSGGASITLTATWTANTYTVTFNKNASDATEANPGTKTVTVPATTIDALPTAPTRTGYTFTGWNTQADGSGTAFVQATAVSANVTVYAQWKSSNANIREVSAGASGSASAPTGTFGLYIGGIPATSNGTPSTTGVITGTGTGAPTNGTIGGNTLSIASGSTVVVIVEDATVSKVEFGRNDATNDTTTTAPTWTVLAKTNDANTPTTLINKRYVGSLAQANITTGYRFWVRITAEDGTTTRVYRYALTIGNTQGYATLTSLSIEGQPLTGTARGTTAGWWNTTAAPSLTAGEVTLTSGNNVAIAASWSVGTGTTTYHYAIIPHTVTMPLKEGDFTGTFTSGNPTSISGLNNGDYILLRAQYNSNNIPILGHCLIKVTIQPATTYTVTFDKNNSDAGSTNASPATKTVTTPATTIDSLPTAPTRTGYTFNGWNTLAGGGGTSFTATTPVSANITVYAQWTVAPVTKSSNANIRAISAGASGNANTPNGLYGLYIGGIPATNNGTPSTNGTITGTGTGAPTNGTIGGNTISTVAGSTVVVIVEDAAVSKVEFGRNGATNDTTAPGTWQTLTKTNDANTPTTLTNKRYVGELKEANTTSNWRFWVRITAEDGTTTMVYRYTLTLGGTTSYGTLTSLSIGGQTLTGAARGTTAGWWNTTVAPSLAAGEVTLPSGDNVAIAASWSLGSSNSAYSYVIIPHTITLPLKEGDFTGAYTSGNPTSISGLNNGDYILLRAQCTPSSATSVPIVGNALIKVTIQAPAPTWSVTAGPGASYTFPRLTPGYTQQSYRTVTLSNSGNQPTGNLTVSLTGTNSGSFEFDSATNTVISSLAAGGLGVGQSENLKVRPKTGLAVGSYSAAINVSGGNSISASYPISVTVSSQRPPTYFGVTADSHYGNGENGSGGLNNYLFVPWMTKLQTHYAHLDYMLFCGDNGSAYQSGNIFWTNVASLISLADSFVTSGFVGENIFITGNHEWQNSGGGALLNNINNSLTTSVPPYTTVKQVAERLNYNNQAQVVTASDYVIYTYGPERASTPSSSFQGFTPDNRAALNAYLASAPTDIPIIILTHFPLHRYPATGTSTRISEYASEVIDILNQYPNVIFLWGHNHSNVDPMYQSIKGPGYTMSTTTGTSTTAVDKQINFLYVPAGCMRDAEYNKESADTYNKGLVFEIDGKKLTFTYYDKDCNVTNKSGWESTAVYNLTGSGYVKQ